MKKLFISYSALLSAIAMDAVVQEELDNGLYFFGCTRDHAFHPGASGEFDEREHLGNKGLAAHAVLVQALQNAEREGRCQWHRPDSATRLEPFAQLNALLERNGQRKLTPGGHHELGLYEDYSYPFVDRLLEASAAKLKSAWRLRDFA